MGEDDHLEEQYEDRFNCEDFGGPEEYALEPEEEDEEDGQRVLWAFGRYTHLWVTITTGTLTEVLAARDSRQRETTWSEFAVTRVGQHASQVAHD